MGQKDVKALVSALELAAEEEDTEAMAELCEQILEADPENIDARFYLAELAYDEGDLDAVIALGEEILERDEFHDEARLLMAEAYLAADQPEDALELCDVLLRKNPNHLEARFVLAEALVELGGAKEAVELYESIVEEQPDHVLAMLGLGVALYESCQFEAAAQALEEVLEIEPELANAYFHLGLIHERKGQTAAAEKSFKRARQLNPEAYPPPLKMSVAEFDKVASEVLKSLPPRLRDALQNVPISVEERPSDQELLASEPPLSPNIWGLFRGQTHAEQNQSDPFAQLPSEIVLFRSNLLRGVSNKRELLDEVRVTLLHEIGHYLGLDEEEVAALGLK